MKMSTISADTLNELNDPASDLLEPTPSFVLASDRPASLLQSLSSFLMFSAAASTHDRVDQDPSLDPVIPPGARTRHPQPTATPRNETTILTTSEPAFLWRSPSSLPVPSATTPTHDRVNEDSSPDQRTLHNETTDQPGPMVTPLQETTYPDYLECLSYTSGTRSRSPVSVQGSGTLLITSTLLLVVAAASFAFAVACWAFNAFIQVVGGVVLATLAASRSFVPRLVGIYRRVLERPSKSVKSILGVT